MTCPVSPEHNRGAIDPDAKPGSTEGSPSASKPDQVSEISGNISDARLPDPSAHGEHHVSVPAQVLHQIAILESRFSLFNATWLICATLLVPIIFAVVWFGLVPVGNPQGDIKDKLVWVFLVNPITMSFLSYLLISLFFVVLDTKAPWRPIWAYFPILVANFLAQLLMPGLVVLFHGPFGVLALPTIALCVIVTLLGLRATPKKWLSPHQRVEAEADESKDPFPSVFHTFKKICIVFVVYAVVLALFMIAQVKAEGGVGQGFVTVAINVCAFIFKKILLAMTDKYDIESAMVIAGLWVENLTDVFIVVAFPAIVKLGPTFAIVFLTRVIENMATMAFQLNAWFKFRVWIKGKFKPDQKHPIEDDCDEDDRGHSNSHPGYRRRQFRFFVWKMLSQLESYLFYLVLAPVLRYGPNRRRFPFSAVAKKFSGTHLKDSLQALSDENYKVSLAFAGFSLLIVLVAAALSFAYMRLRHPYILRTLAARYDAFIVSAVHYSLVLSILVTNALISMMYLNVYYRVYFF